MHRIVYAFRLIPYIRKSLANIRPHSVLSFGEWFNSYIILATRFLGIPVFVSDRMGPDMNLGFLLENSRKLTYRFADGIIAQTKVAANRIFERTGAKEIIVIPNGVNWSIQPVKYKKKQIVTVGRLSPEKGHIHLLKAFHKLSLSDWTLHIIGDGKGKEHLLHYVKTHEMEMKVVFHGHLKDFAEILVESSIFVLPSLYEGFPNALLEAMCIPLACVSTDCVAGPSEIIVDSFNGLLVKPGDVTALADAIQLLVENDNLRNELAENALSVREKYHNDKISNEYLNYICKSEY